MGNAAAYFSSRDRDRKEEERERRGRENKKGERTKCRKEGPLIDGAGHHSCWPFNRSRAVTSWSSHCGQQTRPLQMRGPLQPWRRLLGRSMGTKGPQAPGGHMHQRAVSSTTGPQAVKVGNHPGWVCFRDEARSCLTPCTFPFIIHGVKVPKESTGALHTH